MSGGSIIVRAATAADVPVLCAFNAAMALETEALALDSATLQRGVALGLADPARARYFLAEADGQAAGCLMLTLEWSDWRAGFWWWIQSVYVPPAFRRRGVYRALHAHVATLAAAADEVVGLRLYAERENHTAHRTYAAVGMHDSHYVVFEQPLSSGLQAQSDVKVK